MNNLIENRQIRVFISSTFQDMQDERDYLMRHTFPVLRELASKRDVTLTELDFDGTVVKHRYPAVGEDIGAVPILRKLVKNGHKLLLNTMRSRNSDGVDTLQPAIDWFAANEIPLYGINENPSQKVWTSSPKVYGNIYIDDGALGAPLKADDKGAPPFINWSIAAIHLFYHGCLTDTDLVDLLRSGAISDEYIKMK